MLPKLNVSLLYKDLLSLCVVLFHFPTVGDAEDTFAERDDNLGLADRLRSNVYTKAMRQAQRLKTTLDGIENADCEPIPLGILLDLQIKVRQLQRGFKRNADGAVKSRSWSSGTLPRLDRATLPGFQGTLTTVKRSIERAEYDDPTLWSRIISPADFEKAFSPKMSQSDRQRRFDDDTYKRHPVRTTKRFRVRLSDLPTDVANNLR